MQDATGPGAGARWDCDSQLVCQPGMASCCHPDLSLLRRSPSAFWSPELRENEPVPSEAARLH